jgi:hypothetical protein
MLGTAMGKTIGVSLRLVLPALGSLTRHPKIDEFSHSRPSTVTGYVRFPIVSQALRRPENVSFYVFAARLHRSKSLFCGGSRRQLNTRSVD